VLKFRLCKYFLFLFVATFTVNKDEYIRRKFLMNKKSLKNSERQEKVTTQASKLPSDKFFVKTVHKVTPEQRRPSKLAVHTTRPFVTTVNRRKERATATSWRELPLLYFRRRRGLYTLPYLGVHTLLLAKNSKYANPTSLGLTTTEIVTL